MVRAEMFVNIALSEGDLRSAMPIEARNGMRHAGSRF